MLRHLNPHLDERFLKIGFSIPAVVGPFGSNHKSAEKETRNGDADGPLGALGEVIAGDEGEQAGTHG